MKNTWVNRSRLRVRRMRRRLVRSWRLNDRRYGWKWRMANGVAALLILTSICLPILQQYFQQDRYSLSDATKSLIGQTDQSLAQQLTFDGAKQQYHFNVDALNASSMPSKLQQNSVGASDKSNTKSYALDVPTDLSIGVTYHDTNSQLSFSLVPEFKAEAGKDVQGHLVFPLTGKNGGNQAIYSLKNNGLKEDIIVPHVSQDTMSFNYQLKLPKSLAARIIPDSNGAIGIYSADPALFGDITYGSSADQARVEKARETSAKNYLVFGLPAPVIKAADDGSIGDASAQFVLHDNSLRVVAKHLQGITVPITIDPSVVVTSTSDFQTNGNNEGNIDFTTSGQITRGAVTGGSILGGWTTNTDTGTVYTVRDGGAAIAYNGYMYMIGGGPGAPGTDVVSYYAAINSNGSLGAWATTSSFSLARIYNAAVAYNGYMYLYGGFNSGSAAQSDVQYAKINSNGTLGTWTTSANAMALGVCRMGYAVYNGYLYATGGANVASSNCGNSSTPTNTVQFAPILATGDVGTWTSSASTFTSARMSNESVAYNGYLYVLAGTVTGTGGFSDTQYAPILASGDLGSWVTATPTMSTVRYRFGITVNNGYIYVSGGSSGGSQTTDVQAALINADGSIGSWQVMTSYSTVRYGETMTAYNGYLYVMSGFSGGSTLNDNQYAKIDPAGTPAAFTTNGNSYTTNRHSPQAVAYNNFLYIMGGDNSAGTPNNTIYAGAIAASGSVGAFTNTGMTAFTTNRTMFGAFAYNGYMYVLGGCSASLSSCNSSGNLATVYSAPINAADGTIGSWTIQTSFTTARYGFATAVYDGYVYIMGGLNNASFQNDVQYASLGASGAITSWTAAGATYNIPTARAGFNAAVSGNYIYFAGGCSAGTLVTCTTRKSDIQYAQLSSTGGFSTVWASAGSAFTNARYGLGVSVINNTLYIAGGYDNTTYYADTQFAPINTDGTIGSWTAGTSFATSGWGSGVTAYNGVLYVAGGLNSGTANTSVRYAAVNNGGTGATGAWTTNGTSLATPYSSGWAYGRTFASGGYLYTVGGYNGSTTYAATYSAPISTGGSVGSWTAQTSLNTSRYHFGLAVYNGYVYALAGQNGGTSLATYEYAQIASSGGLGSWTSANITAGSTIGIRTAVAAAAYNGYIYLSGGLNSGTRYTDVYAASANADGSLTWKGSAVNSFTGTRSGQGSVAYNGYLYILGGYDGSNYLSDIQYATINTDGTLGSWAYTTGLDIVRAYASVAAGNGYVYVYGGTNSGGDLADVSYAPILSTGQLGAWQQSAGGAFGTKRMAAAGTLANGTLYLLGGFTTSGSTYRTDVQYASANTTSRQGRYSKFIDLSTANNLSSISYNGTLPGGLTAMTVKVAGTNAVFGSSLAISPITSAGGCTGPYSYVRYLIVTIILDDSQGGAAAYPDTASSSNLTDFTVNYSPLHPTGDTRLRMGGTLQSGIKAPLDTCTG